MRKPMLLRSGHHERLAVPPGPGPLWGPFQPVFAYADVAAIVLSADGQKKAALELRDGRLQEAATLFIRDFLTHLFNRQRLTIKGTNHAGYRTRFVCRSSMRECEQNVAVG